MADVTVSQLAETIDTPVDRLLQQMQEAGLPQKSAGDPVTEEQKQSLLAHIKKSHGEDDSAPKKITLKRRTISTLKTGGSSGRGRTVNVEVRKKRTYVRRTDSEESAPAAEAIPETPVVDEKPAVIDEEAVRRAAAAEAEAEAERKRQEAARQAAEAAEQKAREEEQRKLEAEQKALEEAARTEAAKNEAPVIKTEQELEEARIAARKGKRDRTDIDDDADTKEKRSKHGSRKRKVEALKGDVEELIEEINVPEPREVATLGLSTNRNKRQKGKKGPSRHQFNAPKEVAKREVEIGESITVSQLSQKMSVKATDIIKMLMGMGVMANINQSIDQETAQLIVEEMGHTVKILDADAIEKNLLEEMALEGEEQPRAPVVTVMGHVDHGKTSLLDYIRSSRVASGEAGGITQHIGAYRVNTDHGEICFIDTPGHAAFTAMRQRGANATDVVILVVAADDGVMPQTEEAIKHAKAAGAPIIVAVNKMDKEGADPERVKSELAGKDVIPEDWGGDTQFVQVSALTGQGIEDLLEAVLLQAEILELKAVFDGPARGVIVESELDKGRGPVATLLVQNGTLKQGDIIVAGEHYGRARALVDEHGKNVRQAGPATPVSVLGLNGTPAAGDPFQVAKDEKTAREVAQFRLDKAKEANNSTPVASLDNLLASFDQNNVNMLNVVVKADVRGSLEAIVNALQELGNNEVQVNVVASGVGGISESDANRALTSGAVVFGFNVRADNSARKLIEAEGIDLRYYKVIYDLVDDVRAALSGMLSPEMREEIVGIAEVRDVFDSKKFGNIAGCMVIEGTVYRNKKIRVLRDNVVIYEGELESLRHFKEEANEIRYGTECGIGVKNYNDVRVGDQIEVFDTKEVARKL
ncbi:MAG: translation initiation factor IF-2 [Pseudomonadales bacterium]|nr:translation initiation factor IF-2 [Pseudomonadales bacterium]